MSRYFVTGATGFLGREVLLRLLQRRAPTMVLTRPGGADPSLAAAKARMLGIVRELSPECPVDTMEVALGDVTKPLLGLDASARAWLDGGPVRLVHGAAEVRFDLPYAVMEKQNVEGTRNVLALAESIGPRLERLEYVSTAYVAGDRRDLVPETDIDRGQRPRNDYERSKLAAELAVDAARVRGMPIVVHRPSIIVGDSRTGRASSFKVLYWPMKLYARGMWRTCFGRASSTIDVVPVDYVADAMLALFDEPRATGRIVHLAAGPERQSTIGALAAMAQRFFEGRPVRYFDPMIYHRWVRPWLLPILRVLYPEVARTGGVFLPYLVANPSFATDHAKALLEPKGIAPPPVGEYFETIMAYARDSDFGRRALPPG